MQQELGDCIVIVFGIGRARTHKASLVERTTVRCRPPRQHTHTLYLNDFMKSALGVTLKSRTTSPPLQVTDKIGKMTSRTGACARCAPHAPPGTVPTPGAGLSQRQPRREG
eukprot:5446061-Prymnesium_polylepis.1